MLLEPQAHMTALGHTGSASSNRGGDVHLPGGSSPAPSGRVYFDGPGRGRVHQANNLVVPENMRLEDLPPYSPQLNPMEHIWDEVREKWFANEVFDSLDGVEDRLVEALVSLERNQDLVASITGFDWLINCPLTAT